MIAGCALATMGNAADAEGQPSEPRAEPNDAPAPRSQTPTQPSEAARCGERAQPAAPEHAKVWSFFGGFTSVGLWHPGLHIGADYALSTTTHFQSLVSASFQAYSQPDVESGYAIHLRWGHRYTASFGFTFDQYLGFGIQHTRYDATVFEFQNSIASARERTESRIAFSPHVVFGPGYDFGRLFNVALHFYARPGLTLIYPDMNDAFQASVTAEVGLRWTPDL